MFPDTLPDNIKLEFPWCRITSTSSKLLAEEHRRELRTNSFNYQKSKETNASSAKLYRLATRFVYLATSVANLS
jgi:hypothetical protein